VTPGNLAARVLNRIGPVRTAIERRQRRRGIELYREFVGSGSLCFDVGANVGNRTEMLREIGASVVAIEPQKNCVAALERRFGNDRQVTIVAKGLGPAEGTAMLAVSSADSTISTISERWRSEGRFSSSADWDDREEIEITTLDQVIALHGTPDFCKIDVEGFEAQVLEGLSLPLPALSFEFTREFLDDARACVSLIARNGPVEVSFSLGESMRLDGPWSSAEQTFEALVSRPEPDLWGDVYVRSRPATGGRGRP
jgi:FkbM family methyltransferase